MHPYKDTKKKSGKYRKLAWMNKELLDKQYAERRDRYPGRNTEK